MTRRLILAILGTTVAALLLAGLGTLGIARVRARQTAEKELRREVAVLAEGSVTEARTGVAADRPRLEPPTPGSAHYNRSLRRSA